MTIMESDDDYNNSDVEFDEAAHNKLVQNVLNLSNKQRVEKPTRTEPTLKISEYDLVKTDKGIKLHDLAKSLKGDKHAAVSKRVQHVQRSAKTLPKPLEKPQADRIRRGAAYETSKVELDKWDAIVTALRATDQIKFPLNNRIGVTDKHITSNFRTKSNLQLELEKIDPPAEVTTVEIEEPSEFPMTMAEMMERRKESAKLRAHQSYKEAKARRQNKIKSKKYHRIQKREKAKQQMKEFEELQKSNPEAALEKLEEIEKARAHERMSLRHKGTGKWAKSKQIRAKYDRESRQVLAEQLAISRDLTQKRKHVNDSESDGESNHVAATNSATSKNPWVNNANVKVADEVNSFVNGYRKFWEEKNKDKLSETKIASMKTVDSDHDEDNVDDLEDEQVDDLEDNKVIYLVDTKLKKDNKKVISKADTTVKTNVTKKVVDIEDEQVYDLEDNKVNHLVDKKFKKVISKADTTVKTNATQKVKQPKVKKSKKVEKLVSSGTEWDVTVDDVETQLIKYDNKLQKDLANRYAKVKQTLKSSPKSPKKSQPKPKKSKKIDLSIPIQAKRPILDEVLNETTSNTNTAAKSQLTAILEGPTVSTNVKDIDPNKFMKAKPIVLDADVPDLMDFGDDNEEAVDQRGLISEAFADDDIVDAFRKDKKEEIAKNMPQAIDLSLPGWGSWGGKDLKVSKKKRRRFMVKMPAKMPRKDDNKGQLIVNEDAKAGTKAHLVSEVPFPFKNVKDYEASVRAPIGSTFVPETAFRKLIKPAVVTKMGTIIEPMTSEMLVKKKKKLKML